MEWCGLKHVSAVGRELTDAYRTRGRRIKKKKNLNLNKKLGSRGKSVFDGWISLIPISSFFSF